MLKRFISKPLRSTLSFSFSTSNIIPYYIPKDMDTTEYMDPHPEISSKAQKLADMIASSKRAICYTGAGISTSTGIPDYRSGFNTILATGPGAWETEENKKKFTKERVRISAVKAVPSKTHMALSELMARNMLHYIVTQNVDGLHRRSGIPEHNLTELHGGNNKEICKNCHREYLRDFMVRNRNNLETEHLTGRNCSTCGTALYDTVVFFGQSLRPSDKEKAMEETEKADFGLVLGTSLKVAPASRYPGKLTGHPDKKLAIVNLQQTHLDKKCDLRIGSMCDQTMELVMEKLGIPIPEFKVKRWFSFQVKSNHEYSTLKVKNYNKEGIEYSAIKALEVDLNADKSCDFIDLEEPFEHTFRGNLHHLSCRFQFFGNYGESDLEIGGDQWGALWHPLSNGREVVVNAEYSLSKKKWDILEAKAR